MGKGVYENCTKVSELSVRWCVEGRNAATEMQVGEGWTRCKQRGGSHVLGDHS